MMSDIEARIISRDDYRAFLPRVPHPVFHRLEWIDAIVAALSIRLTLLGLFQDGELVGVSPLFERRYGPLRIFGSPLRKSGIPAAVPFCSPAELCVEAVPALRAWMLRNRLSYLQLTMHGGDNTAFAQREELLDNLEMNLRRPLEEVWNSVVNVQRSAIRKAMRLGVRVHVLSTYESLSTHQRLVDATYEAQGIQPNIPARLYAELLARRAENSLRVLAATHGGRVVATIWSFHDEKKCYYWDAAAEAEARDLNANHLLVWTLIRWAHRRRLATLDFVGAGRGRSGDRPGIGRFKQSMGARIVEYRVLYWHSPLMYAALRAYRWLQNLRTSRRNN